ncbi:MAG: hypothetical protein Q8K33_01415 [Cypionkella sp.]|uniref:hypothetical protein n=1 Tax=Cypionkella sp. TaxID=2811411 RepID=UPI00272F6DCC|nr:hypothetical protein [Cypionkella sp.]MDP2047539.1 hypothetical protein [Cypionkella sp.]
MTSPLSPEAVAQMVADLNSINRNYELARGIHLSIRKAADMLTTIAAENATLRASEAAALERESDMRQALQAAMDDTPGWYDLARDARNASLSARTQRNIARQALTLTADKEPKT